jgi:hypothetical protein
MVPTRPQAGSWQRLDQERWGVSRTRATSDSGRGSAPCIEACRHIWTAVTRFGDTVQRPPSGGRFASHRTSADSPSDRS